MVPQVLSCDSLHTINLDAVSLVYSVDPHEDPCDHNLEEIISGPYMWIIFDHASLLHYGWSRLWQSTTSIFIPLDSPVTATIDITDFYFLTCCFSHHTLACPHFHSLQTVQMDMFLDRPSYHIHDPAGRLSEPGILFSTLQCLPIFCFLSSLLWSFHTLT